jgi:DNA-binding MarR family transcriptional regulator
VSCEEGLKHVPRSVVALVLLLAATDSKAATYEAIANVLGMTQDGVLRIIPRGERLGLLTRTKSRGRGDKVLVSLTPKALEAYRSAFE